ncbi:MAG: hypothetical protein R2862_03025 [Thermoanaerobaculia bacterium]
MSIDSAVGAAPVAVLRIDFFAGPGCGETFLGSTVSNPIAGDTGGEWAAATLTRASTPPGDARSVLVTLHVGGASASAFTVGVDDLLYRHATIFGDGFESGDFARWSVEVPN